MRLINRNLRDAANPFEWPETTFLRLFRLNKAATQYLIVEIAPRMSNSVRSTAVPNHIKIMCALHFFGHGATSLTQAVVEISD